ncbi:hypothetical protein D3248_03310 [Leucobacter zeae]|nr:hypothetical protein [Leucobacter zeae]
MIPHLLDGHRSSPSHVAQGGEVRAEPDLEHAAARPVLDLDDVHDPALQLPPQDVARAGEPLVHEHGEELRAQLRGDRLAVHVRRLQPEVGAGAAHRR